LIPNKLTYYQCQVFELPRLDRKHHIIRVICNLIYTNMASPTITFLTSVDTKVFFTKLKLNLRMHN